MFKNSYSFNDILVNPLYSSCNSRKDISLETKLTKDIILKLPIISSPMDTVSESDMAIKMALKGGLSIIHRFQTIESQCKMIEKVKRHIGYVIEEPYTINENLNINDYYNYKNKYNVQCFIVLNDDNKVSGMITKRDVLINVLDNSKNLVKDIMTTYDDLIYINKFNMEEVSESFKKNKIDKIPIIDQDRYLKGLVLLKNLTETNEISSLDTNKKLLVGGAIGIKGDYMERAERMIKQGVNILCLDTANGYNENVKKAIEIIKKKFPSMPLMVGNVCTAEGFEFLCKAGADCIRVGIGNGSICSTRLNTGIGNCQFSSLLECSVISKKYNIPMISDGGHLGLDGNKFKALSTGACCVMLGKTLAGTTESPGNIIFKNGKRYKYYRGMASNFANLSKNEKLGINNDENNSILTNIEGVEGEVEYKGTVNNVLDRLRNNLCSSMSYVGCNSIEELHKSHITYSIITNNGFNETKTRI